MRLFVLRKLVFVVGVCLCPILVAEDSADAAAPQLPTFSEVEDAVRAHFRSLPDYQSGDIITRSQVEPLLSQKPLEWLGPKREEVLDRLLQDSDDLVTELRSPAGRDFLPQIAKYPNGIDRLDRLSQLGQGKKALRNVIHVRDGYKLIETLATTRNGKALGKVLAKSPDGADFDKPTGRIYTLDMLLAYFEQVYQAKTAPTN
jgi:hypothetical protein